MLWGEVKTLLEEAAADPGTALGAALAGWAYPANLRQLLLLVATIGDRNASQKVMPWAMQNPAASRGTFEEIAQAQAELEDSIVFAN